MDSEYVVELPSSLTGDQIVEIVERTASVAKWKYREMPCFHVSKMGTIPEIRSYRLEVKKGGLLSRFRGGIVFNVSSDPDGHHDYPDDRIRRDGTYTALVMYGYGLDPISMGKFAGSLRSVLEEPGLMK